MAHARDGGLHREEILHLWRPSHGEERGQRHDLQVVEHDLLGGLADSHYDRAGRDGESDDADKAQDDGKDAEDEQSSVRAPLGADLAARATGALVALQAR